MYKQVQYSILKSLADHILELGTKNNILVSEVMEETGSLGADIIIDSGGTHTIKRSEILHSLQQLLFIISEINRLFANAIRFDMPWLYTDIRV